MLYWILASFIILIAYTGVYEPTSDSIVLHKQHLYEYGSWGLVAETVQPMEFSLSVVNWIMPVNIASELIFAKILSVFFYVVFILFVFNSEKSQKRIFVLLFWSVLLLSYEPEHLFRQGVATLLTMAAYYREKYGIKSVLLFLFAIGFHLPVSIGVMIVLIVINLFKIRVKEMLVVSLVCFLLLSVIVDMEFLLTIVKERHGFIDNTSDFLYLYKVIPFFIVSSIIGFFTLFFFKDIRLILLNLTVFLIIKYSDYGFYGEQFAFRIISIFRYFLVPLLITHGVWSLVKILNIKKNKTINKI